MESAEKPLHRDPVVHEMDTFVCRWEEAGDHRATFLRCYMMMTVNTLTAIDSSEFRDPPWVDRLLHRFAEYYFEALDAYEDTAAVSPRAWQLAHDTARYQNVWALQNLLLGVNAHINYDLVLTLEELLREQWPSMSDAKRAQRHEDYLHVNAIIARTIDAVQDDILSPDMPLMGVLDTLMGRMDEFLISRFIMRWRDNVWRQAVVLLETESAEERDSMLRLLEEHVMTIAQAIAARRWRQLLAES